MRNVLGAIIGIAVAVLTVMLFEWISHMTFPPPPGIESAGSEALAEHLASAPVAALILILVGYVVATFDGTLVAGLIGLAKPIVFAMVVGILMLAATVSNLILIPHPTWFSICAVAGIPLAAWLATRIVPLVRRTDAP